MTDEEKTAGRAVHIAAVIMQAAGLCRYDSCYKCRRALPPSVKDCVGCIEKWVLNRAKKEIERENRHDDL